MRNGSLFSGVGGLDLAVEHFFGARTVWHSEIEPGPSRVLAARWPGVPNLGDITAVDWSQVEPVDIITGGSPCQDLSGAGRRSGMTEGTRSNLWVQMREAIAVLKPQIVVWENVRGAYSATADSGVEFCSGCLGGSGDGEPSLRALGRVLGDFADLGFDAEWVGLRAADVGAAHARFRVFVIAHRSGVGYERAGVTRYGRTGLADRGHGSTGPVTLLPTPDASVANDGEEPSSWLARREVVKLTARNGNGMGMPLAIAAKLFPTPKASDGEWGTPRTSGRPIDKATHLSTIASLLPTPTAHDAKKGKTAGQVAAMRARGSGPSNLNETVENLLPTLTLQDSKNSGGVSQLSRNTPPLNAEVTLFPTPRAHDYAATLGSPGAARHVAAGNGSLAEVIGVNLHPLPVTQTVPEYEATWAALEDQSAFWVTSEGVDYWPAISRWAEVMRRRSPSPTIPDGRDGRHRLNPAFAEWLMGLPAGWAAGLSRNEQLKAFGNGVVPQQALAALCAASGVAF